MMSGFIPERIFCIGRNYSDHSSELGNPVPEEPVVFMKPSTSVLLPEEPIVYPSGGGDLHYEAELVIKIGKRGKNIPKDRAAEYIKSIGIGLDLTLRDIQRELKKNGLPWEKSKSFDGSAPLGNLISYEKDIPLSDITFICTVNGEIRQKGNTGDMIFPIELLIKYLSSRWELLKGDIIFTGTPEGVGSLRRGDTVTLEGELFEEQQWKVKEEE